jgi:hypothetical protein
MTVNVAVREPKINKITPLLIIFISKYFGVPLG